MREELAAQVIEGGEFVVAFDQVGGIFVDVDTATADKLKKLFAARIS